MAKKVILLGLALLLTLVPIGCGSDDDNNNDDDDGVVNVYAGGTDGSSTPVDFEASAPAPAGGLQSLTVTFGYLHLRRNDGEFITVIENGSSDNSVDLIAAMDDPQYLESFNVPQGDYNGAQGMIDLVQMTDSTGTSCDVTSGDVEFLTGATPYTVTVDDGGAISVDVVFPIVDGSCETGEVTIGEATIQPHGAR